ncbi:MAG: diheme cytochrome c-553 [Deltaproteobacteria bacterium]|nr:diheme cytochrome c-553 [Deltaproteobacteria bacterium]
MDASRRLSGGTAWLCCLALLLIATDSFGAQKQGTKRDAAARERGKYLVTLGGCHDCHTPKRMTEKGPALDGDRLLAGYPSGTPLPPVPQGVAGPGGWGGLFTHDLTGWAGPWGVSFASNLSPDKETGIGAWTRETFIKVLRTGKTPGGRPLLPPMPWENLKAATDRDLSDLFDYLMSVRPVRNAVPGPIPPKGGSAGGT